MKKAFLLGASLLAGAAASPAQAQPRNPAPMKLAVSGIEDGARIPDKFTYCTPATQGAPADQRGNGGNVSPGLAWSGAPQGTRSFAVVMVDPDVPAAFENANTHGATLRKDMPRQDFYHWLLADIPVGIASLAEGQDSSGITEGGKPTGRMPWGQRGANDYAKVFKGAFGGYDGPCPPWNDELLHRYHIRVYALSVPSLGLRDGFTGPEAMKAMEPHVLGMGEVTGIYSTSGTKK